MIPDQYHSRAFSPEPPAPEEEKDILYNTGDVYSSDGRLYYLWYIPKSADVATTRPEITANSRNTFYIELNGEMTEITVTMGSKNPNSSATVNVQPCYTECSQPSIPISVGSAYQVYRKKTVYVPPVPGSNLVAYHFDETAGLYLDTNGYLYASGLNSSRRFGIVFPDGGDALPTSNTTTPPIGTKTRMALVAILGSGGPYKPIVQFEANSSLVQDSTGRLYVCGTLFGNNTPGVSGNLVYNSFTDITNRQPSGAMPYVDFKQSHHATYLVGRDGRGYACGGNVGTLGTGAPISNISAGESNPIALVKLPEDAKMISVDIGSFSMFPVPGITYPDSLAITKVIRDNDKTNIALMEEKAIWTASDGRVFACGACMPRTDYAFYSGPYENPLPIQILPRENKRPSRTSVLYEAISMDPSTQWKGNKFLCETGLYVRFSSNYYTAYFTEYYGGDPATDPYFRYIYPASDTQAENYNWAFCITDDGSKAAAILPMSHGTSTTWSSYTLAQSPPSGTGSHTVTKSMLLSRDAGPNRSALLSVNFPDYSKWYRCYIAHGAQYGEQLFKA